MLSERVLRSFNRDNLKGLCKKLKLKGYSNLSIDHMIEKIREKETKLNTEGNVEDSLDATLEEYITELVEDDKYIRIVDFYEGKHDDMYPEEYFRQESDNSITASLDYQNSYDERKEAEREAKKKAKEEASKPKYLKFRNVKNVHWQRFEGRNIVGADGYIYITKEESESFNFPLFIRLGYLERVDG